MVKADAPDPFLNRKDELAMLERRWAQDGG